MEIKFKNNNLKGILFLFEIWYLYLDSEIKKL